MQEKIILGVDPSFVAAGFAVIKIKQNKKTELIDLGVFKQSSNKTIQERLGNFHIFFDKLMIEKSISTICLETPFMGKNAQNFLKLGYLRGSLNLLSFQHKLPILEFSPREIKRSVTGYGHADKEQVAKALQVFFPILKSFKQISMDATDALAVALCSSFDLDTNPFFSQNQKM